VVIGVGYQGLTTAEDKKKKGRRRGKKVLDFDQARSRTMPEDTGPFPHDVAKAEARRIRDEGHHARVGKLKDGSHVFIDGEVKGPIPYDENHPAPPPTKDRIPGGKGQHTKNKDFPRDQIEKGMKVEAEHSPDPKVQAEIVRDHLAENPTGYYDNLEVAEAIGGQEKPEIVADKVAEVATKEEKEAIVENLTSEKPVLSALVKDRGKVTEFKAKPHYVLKNKEGKYATYDLKKGTSTTDKLNMAASYPSKEEAEKQGVFWEKKKLGSFHAVETEPKAPESLFSKEIPERNAEAEIPTTTPSDVPATLPDGTQVRDVDGAEVRKVDPTFSEGGHHEPHHVIPPGEIWLDKTLKGEDKAAILEHEKVEKEPPEFDEPGYTGVMKNPSGLRSWEVDRLSKEWSTKRKQDAALVAAATGSNTIEADALIRRARKAGLEPDQVNWDKLQGKDLSQADRIARLEQQTGDTGTSKEIMAEAKVAKGQAEEFEAAIIEQNVEYGKQSDGRPPSDILKDMKIEADVVATPQDWEELGKDKSDLYGWDDKTKSEAKSEAKKEMAGQVDLLGESKPDAKPLDPDRIEKKEAEKKAKKAKSEKAQRKAHDSGQGTIGQSSIKSDKAQVVEYTEKQAQDMVLQLVKKGDTTPKGAKYQELAKAAKAEGINAEDFDKSVNELIDHGDIFEPTLGYLKYIE
jgi:hypothetical protein